MISTAGFVIYNRLFFFFFFSFLFFYSVVRQSCCNILHSILCWWAFDIEIGVRDTIYIDLCSVSRLVLYQFNALIHIILLGAYYNRRFLSQPLFS